MTFVPHEPNHVAVRDQGVLNMVLMSFSLKGCLTNDVGYGKLPQVAQNRSEAMSVTAAAVQFVVVEIVPINRAVFHV
ncbi:hypothetical protein NQZ79_g6715 [Umbelopsis isabellina]|nr:hypothetical protein NQZ79_g6715 [Umbelopsis isabellina]